MAALGLIGLAIIVMPAKRNQEPAANAVIEPVECKNLVAGCGNARLSVHVDQQPKVMQPFILSVQATKATALHASFAMQGMEMGLNRYRLIQQANGKWLAAVTLPVCVQGRSDWAMLIEVRTVNGLQRYQVRFQAER